MGSRRVGWEIRLEDSKVKAEGLKYRTGVAVIAQIPRE